MRHRTLATSLLAITLLLLSCVSLAQTTSNSLTFTVNNPVPTVASLSPASAVAGGTSLTLTIAGANFVTTTTATFNGVAKSFSFVGPTSGTIVLATADLTTLGTFPVCVSNPTPGGGGPACSNFQVTTSLATSSIAPTSCVLYSTCSGLSVTITGSGFVAGSVINWNGAALATTFVSATQLKATVPTATAGSVVTVTVTNPVGSAAKIVTLTWDAPQTTPVPISGYNVYRADSGSMAFSVISGNGIIPSTQTTMDDSGVALGKAYDYYITSYGDSGSGVNVESDPSTIASVIVQ